MWANEAGSPLAKKASNNLTAKGRLVKPVYGLVASSSDKRTFDPYTYIREVLRIGRLTY